MNIRAPTPGDFEYEIGARLARGDLPGAATVASGCRIAWPSERSGWLLGSIAALLANEKEAALALIEERLVVEPAEVQCLLQKAECLLALGNRPASLAAAEAAAVSANEVPAALDAVGQFLVHSSDHAGALKIYTRAVTLAPDDADLLAKRATVHRFLGNFDRAISDYERVLRVSPRDAEALEGLSGLRRQSAEHNLIGAMEAALAAAPAAKEAATLHFGLAKSYEDLEDYPASWRHLSAGNALERAAIPYEPALDRAVFERIIEAFPGVEPAMPDLTSEQPIFIVGLPRTGTTLVERIIGNHSQVHSAGELTALAEAVAAVASGMASHKLAGWGEYAAIFGELDGPSIAREYLARARVRRGSRPRFSDKQPLNLFYCALILRAFPKARIVHLTRHPVAACYALYKTRFQGTCSFSYDLSELGDFYVGYHRLMAHFHRVLPGRILDVAYEDVVLALEPTTRRLLDYLDLPFEDRCLEFHLNPDAVTTASAVQVRQPLYDSSLAQWRHYTAELAPLRARLQGAGIPAD